MREITAALLHERLARGHLSLLDAGCGTGGFLAWAAGTGSFDRLAGVDISAEAVELAEDGGAGRRAARGSGARPSLRRRELRRRRAQRRAPARGRARGRRRPARAAAGAAAGRRAARADERRPSRAARAHGLAAVRRRFPEGRAGDGRLRGPSRHACERRAVDVGCRPRPRPDRSDAHDVWHPGRGRLDRKHGRTHAAGARGAGTHVIHGSAFPTGTRCWRWRCRREHPGVLRHDRRAL